MATTMRTLLLVGLLAAGCGETGLPPGSEEDAVGELIDLPTAETSAHDLAASEREPGDGGMDLGREMAVPDLSALDLASVDQTPVVDLATADGPPNCHDQKKNAGESDVDCGGPMCARCPDAKSCARNDDCLTQKCVNGKCQGGTVPKLAFVKGQTLMILPDGALLCAAGDVNKDGKVDLVVVINIQQQPPTAAVLLGKGDGTFGAPSKFVGDPQPSAVIADYDGDKNPDIISEMPNRNIGNRVGIFFGDGKGSFSAPLEIAVEHQADFLATADFNLDGHLDIATSGRDGLSVIWNLGPKNLPIVRRYGNNWYYAYLATTDLNSDGLPDLVAVALSDVFIFLAAPVKPDSIDVFRKPPVQILYPNRASHLHVMDVNRDGRADLVAETSDGKIGTLIEVRLNDGAANFVEPGLTTPSPTPFLPLVSADFDGNGTTDLSITERSVLAVQPGFGDGWFAPRTTVANDAGSILVADFNGDGRADFAYSPRQQPQIVQILLNTSK